MRSQNLLASVGFTVALVLSQPLSLISPVALAIPNPIDNGNKQTLPPVPSTPRPSSGTRTPGGGLTGEPSFCPVTPQKLTAITPADVYGRSISDTPTFWFYSPYSAADVDGGEFSVLTEDEFDRVYETSFKLPDQPGLVSITLPADVTATLEEGANYHWYLSLACVVDETTETELNIDGWVQWLQPTPERQELINDLSPEFWYDVLDNLVAKLPGSSPDALEVAQWHELLKSVELADLSEKPIVGSVIITDE